MAVSGRRGRRCRLRLAPARSPRAGHTALIDAALFRGRNVRVALIVNFVVGAALVIAMVDVPLFVNAVEVDLERSAVVAGWILSALTAAMALLSYIGGRVTERTWYGPPIVHRSRRGHARLHAHGPHVGRRHAVPGARRCNSPCSAAGSG